MHTFVILFGSLTILVEFLFIFLATNQNKVYNVHLESVPTFEFEDRGCERVKPPVLDGCSNEGPITKKDGFTSKANLQICHGWAVAGSLSDVQLVSNEFFVYIGLENGFRTHIIVEDAKLTTNENVKLGLMLENGKFYVGDNNKTGQHLNSALRQRLQRTNATFVLVDPKNISTNSDAEHNVLRVLSGLHFQRVVRKSKSVMSAMALVNVSLINLNMYSLNGIMDEDFFAAAMHKYLHSVAKSIMFPTGTGRGINVLRSNEIEYLDEETTPLAYYNRPWIGVVSSIVISGVLILVWTFLVFLGIEGGVDPRWAWKEFFTDTYTILDFGKGCDESKELIWRCDTSGSQTFGFTPRF
ncbi:hypothetical protein FGB62_113g115 [Gracilaria domingensis]|nr:hypothetical protein FGB62_113g115 [Gracilaria domingensis]